MRSFFDKIYGKGDSYQAHLNRKPPSTNPGQDVLTPIGQPIFAPTTCSVQALIDQNGGKFLNIEYGTNKWQLVHLSAFGVKGPTILEGLIIGYSGNTGNSTGPHTHATLYISGKRVDPMLHFPELLFPITNTEMVQLQKNITVKTLHTNILNLRKEPSTKSPSLGTIPVGASFLTKVVAKGELVSQNGRSSDTWYQVKQDTNTGYINACWADEIGDADLVKQIADLKIVTVRQKAKIDNSTIKAEDLLNTLKA